MWSGSDFKMNIKKNGKKNLSHLAQPLLEVLFTLNNRSSVQQTLNINLAKL